MGCYSCKQSGLDKPEVGFCKECNVGACHWRIYGHGGRCKVCGIFYCNLHQETHAKSHGLRVFDAFPANARRAANLVGRLREFTGEEANIVIDLGKVLSDWVEDEDLRRDFEELARTSQKVRFKASNVEDLTSNILKRLRARLASFGIEIKE